MFQERAYVARNWEESPIPPGEIDAVLLTHVHIDHSGLLPKLVRDGFRGPIYCTAASASLADIVLRDSAEIQVEDAEYKRKRHAKEGRRGRHPEVPLYTVQDVERTLPRIREAHYYQPVRIGDRLQVTFCDAGHILGSAMLDIRLQENGTSRRILFSGDIGQWDKPLIRDPTLFDSADYVVMESTYGDREHEDSGDIESQLCDVINRTVDRGGNVVIPTFAVERAQEVIYHLGRLVHEKQIPNVDLFLDSPMAVDVTEVFRQHRSCLDEETWNLINSNHPPLRFPGLHLIRSSKESRAINSIKSPCIIMASSGMCTAGRIKHHLRQNIKRPESTILFVGYQGRGTLGRSILDGHDQVRIHGRNYPVRAETAQIHGFSGHADRTGLLRWLGHLSPPPKRVFLTHGEEDSAESLARSIRRELNAEVTIPEYQQTVQLTDQA
jgi:metallo-beta-lactamase family protein